MNPLPHTAVVLRRDSLPASAWLVVLLSWGLLMPLSTSGQLFTNLNLLVNRLPAGDPVVEATNSLDGPKGLCTADFNMDQRADLAIANTDGTVTLYYGQPEGKFAEPVHLRTGAQELRGITCGDVTGDGRPDIATASPYAGKVFLFINRNGQFGSPVELMTWPGARNLAVADFDGDLLKDLLVGGTTNGVRQLRSLGEGAFEVVTNLGSLASINDDFPKPVYSFAAFRPGGTARDEVAVTHADSDEVWILAPGETDALEIRGSFPTPRVHTLAVGAITQPATNDVLDLIVVSRARGTVDIHPGDDTPLRFEEDWSQRIEVPGGPRAVEIVDLDGDGWNDIVVVLRNFDRVVVYANSNGVLQASEELPVGISPREVVSADFDQDGNPDVAVMNRDSMDVSLLYALDGTPGFGALDLTYPVDGEVSGLVVFDFNEDGRDDVMQLHRSSGEFSIRLALEGGILSEPRFFPVGSLPSAQSAVDVNNDGIADLVTANLGRTAEVGSVSVRLGDGLGGFGEEQRFYLPPEAAGSLFALVAADFDNDGNVDLAAGFFDCRLAFFKGFGDGTFEFTTKHRFVTESRVMVTGDFDQDGDVDLAGAGYAGHVVVIENLGDLLTTPTLRRFDYPPPGSDKFGTRDILTTDLNGDGDLDLLVGSGSGTMLFLGGEGMSFSRASDALPGTKFPNSAVAMGDFDGDGTMDLAVSCRILSCISILIRNEEGDYIPTATVNVPSGQFLASGDLDGDGLADLVGSGGVLWTALSSRRGEVAPPNPVRISRPTIPHPVINEFLAINTDWPLTIDGDRTSDWIEFFNGSSNAVSLSGWKLQLIEGADDGAAVTNEFVFPPTAFFQGGAHLTVVCSEIKRTVYHTGFRLPGGGGALRLINPGGEQVDSVEYGRQLENVAYGRYADGVPALGANPYPSPGRPNTDNGPVDPAVEIEEINHATLAPGQPIRFAVTARDDIGVIGMSLVYQRLDIPEGQKRVQLFDDGEHDDGAVVDGLFAGLLQEGFPAGAEVQFYIEAVDLSDKMVVEPDEPVFGGGGGAVSLFSLAVEVPVPLLEISEVVASNVEGLVDETGSHPDWVEVRNCSGEAVSLAGLQLASRFFGNKSRFAFGAGDLLLPGEHRVVFCDNQPDLGPAHAPFELNRSGDRVVLTGLTGNGVRTLIDEVEFGEQLIDIAYARLGCGGDFRAETPTPELANVPGTWLGIVDRSGSTFTLAFPTQTNRVYTVEHIDSLGGSGWTEEPSIPGNGIEQVITQPLVGQRYYRVREETLD